MTINALKNQRPTIAVMTNMMATPFSEGIIFGATDYATKYHYNVLCFSGAAFAKPSPINMSRHRIFELIDSSIIAGVIVPIGSLSRFISLEEQKRFLHQFANVPVITVASYIPGYMDVGYSPEQGMRELVNHLVERHHVKRFAFAGASGIHQSTIIKKQALINAIKSHGLHFDEAFLIKSDTHLHAHIPELEQLFARPPERRPQAIIAGTDNLARIIIMALKRLNIRVPEDVIVTGSMGKIDSVFTEPSLTSIVEPTYELGWHAAERVIAAIEGKPYHDNLVLQTSLAIRRSCGCNDPLTLTDLSSIPALLATSITLKSSVASLRQQLNQVLCNTPSELADSMPFANAEPIIELLLSDLRNTTHSALNAFFIAQFEQLLSSDAVYTLSRLVLCIHQYLLDNLGNINTELTTKKMAIDLFNTAQIYGEKAARLRSFSADKYVGIMREIGLQLNSEFDLDQITLQLAYGLNITDYYICILEHSENTVPLASCIMAMRNNVRLKVASDSFPAMQLLPPDMLPYHDAFSLLVMPLSFKEELLGYCVFSLGERKGVVYEGLLTLFSSAVKNKIHLRNLIAAEKKFSDIAHSASDWLWEIDTRGYFRYCSAGVENVLGYTPKQMLEQPLIRFLDKPNQDYVTKFMGGMKNNLQITADESYYRHKDGSLRILLTSGKAIIKSGTIIGYRGAYKDITKIKAQEARIRNLAFYDPLTQLPNRTQLNEQLHNLVTQSLDSHCRFAVLFVDLDGFKLVNDSMGHNAGDQLLHTVSRLFAKCLGENDILARFGGDEFVVILPSIECDATAEYMAKKITESLASPLLIFNKSMFITASIGIAIFPRDGINAESLLVNADKAMYQVKRNGKNRFSFYQRELEDSLSRKIIIHNLLHTAIRNDSFSLLFQPLIDAKTGRVSGVESLVRLTNIDSQLSSTFVGPDEFIPLAEDIGLIEKIGLWVFEAACKQQQQWIAAGIQLSCSVNVSAKQFRNPNLAKQFIALILNYGVNPNLMTIEVTENAVIYNEEHARNTLQQLSNYGLKIAIDDFGTGYASLSYLQKMPFDILKIDRSFVVDCTDNGENAKIITAIIMMAKSLNLSVVIEGVETREQYHFLVKLGGDTIQGYLFAKPLTAQQIPSYLNSFYLNPLVTTN
jgi:diguanylate cyclase (GGDEF)-like protein/PAS domain S-box-containing protein